MKVLFIAPLPPPMTGNSLAAKTLFDYLNINHNVEIIHLRKDSFVQGFNSINRLLQIGNVLKDVWRKNQGADVIYLSISQSPAGNLRDVLIYLICYKKLEKTIIHLFGGAGMKSIVDKNGIQYKLNKFFFRQLKGAIVEGQIQASTLSKLMPSKIIHIVPNFAEDYLFVSEKEIINKFSNKTPLKILFLSNMLFGKGHNELVDAYISLKDDKKEKVEIIFVGEFESENHKDRFLKRIDEHKGLVYYGNFVSGKKKKALYSKSHIFCLPTYFPYEGQPISILEAYATGCVVITTNHSGIPDIFCDKVNGFEVLKKSVNSLKLVIEEIIKNNDSLVETAISNRNVAYNKYRTSIYNTSLTNVII
tara:strand:- start:127 stop:1212 length:1086 start_codon:yes stop_codon:yes gene_type:complete